MTALINLRTEAPARPVDWRWLLAQAIHQSEGRYRPRTDEYVDILLSYQEEVAACTDEYDRVRVDEQYPDLAWALRLRDDDTDMGSRAEIEARLLARDKTAHIARRLGASIDTVLWYEAAFFNVTDRYQNESYLLHQGIGSSIQTGIAPHEFDKYWKIMGLSCGPLLLDALVGFCKKMNVADVGQIESALAEQQRSLIRRQATRAAAGLKLRDPFAALQTMEIEGQHQERERQSGEGEARDTLVRGVQSFFDSLGNVWKSPNEVTIGIQARLRNAVATPRASELMNATYSGTTEQLAEVVCTRTFPAPPARPEQIVMAPTAPRPPEDRS